MRDKLFESSYDGHMCRKEYFYWVLLKDVANHFAGMMLH